MTTPVAQRSRASTRLPVAKRDRRPALAALALLLIVAGALGAALVVYRSGQRTDVMVAAQDINAGERVTASDFGTARVAAGSGSVVPAASERNFIGSFATTDIPSGTLINSQMFQSTKMMPPHSEVVPVTPPIVADGIVAGSVVRARYAGSSGTGVPLQPGEKLANAVRVVDIVPSSTGSGSETVSLLVRDNQEAEKLVAASNEGNVVLTLLPTGTKPDIDYRKTKTS